MLKQGKELQNKREKRKLAPAASPKKRTMKLDRALAASQATAEDDKDEEENSTSDSEEWAATSDQSQVNTIKFVLHIIYILI